MLRRIERLAWQLTRDFTLIKLPGEFWRPGHDPDSLVPVEFGSCFGAFSKL